eukprot:2247596-Alexandrium_andersonii.AAC.1
MARAARLQSASSTSRTMICWPDRSRASPTTSSAEKQFPVRRPAARPTASASAAPPVRTKRW